MEHGKKAFYDFLSFFPVIELPITIQESDHHTFSTSNDQLPDILLTAYITPYLDFELDEFSEFLPCFQFEYKADMFHVVIWTARLMHYSFYLFNFDKFGNFIDQREIAGFFATDQLLVHKMARIDEEGSIFIVEGGMHEGHIDFDPTTTQKWELDIADDGRIVEFKLQ
jgi:hypothetical protein